MTNPLLIIKLINVLKKNYNQDIILNVNNLCKKIHILNNKIIVLQNTIHDLLINQQNNQDIFNILPNNNNIIPIKIKITKKIIFLICQQNLSLFLKKKVIIMYMNYFAMHKQLKIMKYGNIINILHIIFINK